MKILILLLLNLSFLFAGGDLLTINPQSKFDKVKYFSISKEAKKMLQKGKSCNCGTPAILYPYYGEDIPIAKTEPCLDLGCIQ
jgi:hypothetical protein